MTPLADLIHAALAKLFPRAIRSSATARHHVGGHRARGGVGALAGTVLRRLEAERRTAAAHAALRAECDRMAQLLTGVRRGRADAARFAHAVSRTKATLRQPARARFTAAPHQFLRTARATRTAVRTAGREAVAVAARAARQVGAHRHVGAATREYHDLAAQILARAKAYGAGRARGENGMFARSPRGLPA